MFRLLIAPSAELDIEDILAWSQEHFGGRERERYEALLVQGLRDLAENPEGLGALHRPELAKDTRTYHLFHSGDRVAPEAGRVHRPRHLLVYRVRDETVEIARVLHDNMEIGRHLPVGYRNLRDP